MAEQQEEDDKKKLVLLGEEIRREHEEALLGLMEQQTKSVHNLRHRLSYYTSQLDQAEKKLEETQQKLAQLRGRVNVATSTSSHGNDLNPVKVERRSMSPVQISDDSSESIFECKREPDIDSTVPLRKSSVLDKKRASTFQKNNDNSHMLPKAKPLLVIPVVKPIVSQPLNKAKSSPIPCGTDYCAGGSSFTFRNSIGKLKPDTSAKSPSDIEASEIQSRGTKRKFEQEKRIKQKQRKELIPLIRSSSSASKIDFQASNLIHDQHNRKMRTIVLCPTDDQLFVSSALDGVVNLWQVQDRGSSANLLSSSNCLSPEHRKWPEDIAWHPEGSALVSVYSADGGNSQISILHLNDGKKKMRVNFLEEKPHVKGIINNVRFMPWEDNCFVTGGSDHAVALWTDKDGEDSWKANVLHGWHSSAVMGVAGLQHKKVVMSAGADKRIVGYDLQAQGIEYKHQLDNKCMSVLPNPRDVNLYMVQTGTLEKQLRLFDFRSRQTEIHSFGWKQESSDSQSALINQAWSPDGLYITSGSVDPVIHIFDIRYNSQKPSQSIKAHDRRVFKAVWHHTLPLLISISSDRNIGLHKIV